MHFVLVIILLVVSGIANAATVTLDFDHLDANTTPTSVNEDGFLLTTNEIYFIVSSDPTGPSGDKTLNSTAGGSYFISQESGAAFDLVSLDAIEWQQDPYAGTNPTRVLGTCAAGGQIELVLPIPDSLVWSSVLFDSAWSDLSSIEIIAGGNSGFILDDVVLTAVPVPAAVWLFGSALAGLGWVRRKQAA